MLEARHFYAATRIPSLESIGSVGPLVVEFIKWIIAKARQLGCDSLNYSTVSMFWQAPLATRAKLTTGVIKEKSVYHVSDLDRQIHKSERESL